MAALTPIKFPSGIDALIAVTETNGRTRGKSRLADMICCPGLIC
jgi:hypothetical protein